MQPSLRRNWLHAAQQAAQLLRSGVKLG